VGVAEDELGFNLEPLPMIMKRKVEERKNLFPVTALQIPV
jgi:hypothetical protein